MANPYEPPKSAGNQPVQPAPRVALVFVASLMAMLPWPLIAVGLAWRMSLFDSATETLLPFGAVTVMFLLPIMVVVEIPEAVLATVALGVWVLVLAGPGCWFLRRPPQRATTVTTIVLQALFAVVQAGLGFLVLLGKLV